MEDGAFTDEVSTEFDPITEVGDLLRGMVTITRDTHNQEMGTFGILTYKDFKCVTLEPPWRNNAQFISCVPPGIYPIKLGMFYQTENPYKVWELKQIAGRSDIDIHIGNTIKATQGCILLGTTCGCLDDMWAILGSEKAHGEFMSAMKRHGAHKAEKMLINICNVDLGTWSPPAYATVG